MTTKKMIPCPNCGKENHDPQPVGLRGTGTGGSILNWRCKTCHFRFPQHAKAFKKQEDLGMTLSHPAYWEGERSTINFKIPPEEVRKNILEFYGDYTGGTKPILVGTMAGIPDAGKPQTQQQVNEAYIRQMQSQGNSTYEQQHGGEPLLDKLVNWMNIKREPRTAADYNYLLELKKQKHVEKVAKWERKDRLRKERIAEKGGKVTSLNIGFCRTCGYKISDKSAKKAIWKARKHVKTHGYKV